jgi:fructoselysine-6-P-deglycase FrlB-like protein
MIKLDVQGYEWQLIKGGKKTIENNQPLILLESNPERSEYDKKVLDFLRDLGYSNYRYLINTKEDCILINRNSDRYTQAIDIIEQMDDEYNLTKEF